VAAAGARAGRRPGAVRAAGRAGVEHLLPARLEVRTHPLGVAHEAPVEACREAPGRGRGEARLHGPAFRPPLREAAVEDGDALVAEGAKGPPDARRADDATRVVDHDEVPRPDPERADAPGERPGR